MEKQARHMLKTNERVAYSLVIPKEFMSAIEWHGNRCCTSEFICRNVVYQEDGSAHLSLREYEMWGLQAAWEDDDYCLSCGSAELNQFISNFIEEMV